MIKCDDKIHGIEMMKIFGLVLALTFILSMVYIASKPSNFDDKNFTIPRSATQDLHFNDGTKYNSKKSRLVQINEVKVVKQTYDTAWFEISYIYYGDTNPPLYMGAAQRLSGEIQGWFAYRPSKPLQKGEGKAIVRLSLSSDAKMKNKEYFSDQIEINIYPSGGMPIHEELFGFIRIWCSNSDPFWKLDSPCRVGLF